ncbi:MAG TPA: 23S rRNA (pseudouridine(1915)-N(3))-methyltransferase RlmH [Miltoncostaeaceae bacterium]|nr:23S rRNA (pseudouridine(1915)-N(3))-methyltransferase RlmH [Miltoncostaeaceae bacterium]
MSRRDGEGGGTPRLQLVVVGRVRPPWADAAHTFEERVARRHGLRVDEVAAEPLQRGGAHARRQEAERIRARLVRGAWRVAVTPEGRAPASSDAFAGWLRARLESGRPTALLVGGASGLEDGLVAECEERLSLGTLTMPHQLARVVLVEQIYRAQCIIDGHPYPH